MFTHVLLEINVGKLVAVDPHLAVSSVQVVIVLADIDHIAANLLDPHGVAVVTVHPDSHRVHFGCRAGGDTCTYGVIYPLVGVTLTAPIGHVSIGLIDFPGCITDAFTVVHTPAV